MKTFKSLRRIGLVGSLCACVLLMLSGSALAYIDPAATSYLIQIVAGLFITAGVVFGIFWKKIRLFFRGLRLKMLERKLTQQAEKNQPAGDSEK